ncbi:MAG: nucleotide pyrophosphohydrolase [Candidatus Doudnabacteria bacterium]|nr:nucleotide pyrophosphohydrolase [Candidatus Doudnabacteria bacterium]
MKKLTKKIVAFRDARNWKQFHNPKDMVLSLVLEAAEVAEHFQWKNAKEMQEYIKEHRNDIGEELADAFYWVLLISNDLNIDLEQAFNKKMKQNKKKYPVSKAKGRHDKYTKL